jgi:hypothetical protein
MATAGSTRQIVGYVSAYLKQPLRSLSEAGDDLEAKRRLDREAISQVDVKTRRGDTKKPRS